MKKGFTLLELLGVLVLITIVSLIAYLIVFNVIRETREKVFKQNEKTLISLAENYVFINTPAMAN